MTMERYVRPYLNIIPIYENIVPGWSFISAHSLILNICNHRMLYNICSGIVSGSYLQSQILNF